MNHKFILICTCLLFLLASCGEKKVDEKKTQLSQSASLSNNEQEEAAQTDAAQEKAIENAENIEAPPLPQTLTELAELPPGYTGPYLSILEDEDQKKIDELTKDLQDISGEPTKDELDLYYRKLLSIFQHDFNGPEELLAKLRFQAIGSPDIEDPRMQFKENMNVHVILDASGSMRKDIGGQTQMEAAKKAITRFVEGLPAEANVGLRIYGHKGTGSDSDKEMSCSSSELIYPLEKYDEAKFQASLNQAQPAGWTPIQLALNEAEKDLDKFNGENNTNIVYLVSDGVSTCDDDPIAAAKSLYDSDITPIVNVIGFNVDHAGQKQLKEVAKATEGSYQDVQDYESLQEELDQAQEIAAKWKDWKKQTEAGLKYDKTKNGLDIFVYESKEYKKRVDEGQQVGFTLQYLYQTKKLMSRESHDYLREKNREYHNWIEEEYKSLKRELKELNEKNINEALQQLEEKYSDKAPNS
ncbi:VWA domain-containing protein [Siminovitchia acidinfaciens]|uniref:VWA domain-containing protein n=1 Tax=Siminovitchia acidinfaciens TaxID=2321395 RepID=A0A429XY72_9BACI|nr:VWA domain-containing protein [Siminovitchia acidinfaciens]RST73687.1 VWA domain-containing protein [Siminovitchia acidinfaciens]